jgi:hypothetical protein
MAVVPQCDATSWGTIATDRDSDVSRRLSDGEAILPLLLTAALIR